MKNLVLKSTILGLVAISAIIIGTKTPAISSEIENWIFRKSPDYSNYETLRDTSIRLNDEVFIVEVADTPEERAIGLMNRQSLAKNEGMIFIFEQPGIYKFWMKDTYISLDIIWLNEKREVIFIEKNTTPLQTSPSYGPDENALYVIEVLAGTADRVELSVGDKISFSPNLLSFIVDTPTI